MKRDAKMCKNKRRGVVPAWIDSRVLVALGLFATLAVTAYSAAPSWWAEQGIHNDKPANDYAVANQGQLKNVAKAARNKLVAQGHFPLGQSNAINVMVNAWTTSHTNAQDYAPVNLGQLKAVAKPFYDALALPYPWSGSTQDDNDYAVANIGQLKAVFAFPIEALDTDSDGLPDTWEMTHFGTLNRNLLLDTDGDGVSDRDEWAAGTNPRDWRSHPGDSAEASILLFVYTPLAR